MYKEMKHQSSIRKTEQHRDSSLTHVQSQMSVHQPPQVKVFTGKKTSTHHHRHTYKEADTE